MTTFALHGWEIPIADLNRLEEQVQGRSVRAASSRLRKTRQVSKGQWTGKTSILDPSEARTIKALLNSEADAWSFEHDVYSSKSLAFSSVPARDSTNFKFGAYAMTATSGVTYTVTWTDATVRTVLVWRRAGSGSFNHYALVLTGASVTSKYKNGSTTAETVTNWFTPSADGSFALLGKNDSGTDTTVQYDDLVVLPGAAPADAIAAWAARTEAWDDPPSLRVEGDLIDATGDPISVIPEYKGSAYVQAISPVTGSFTTNLEVLSFELRQV